MIKCTLPIWVNQKPRGQIGRYGNITHSIGGYREWQQETALQLKIAGLMPFKKIYAISLRIFLKKRRGGKPDVDNMYGAMQDLLVREGYLKDDDLTVVPEIHCKATYAEYNSAVLFVCENLAEWVYLVSHYEELAN